MFNRLLECRGGENVGGRTAKEGVSEMLEALGQDTQKPAPVSSAKTFCESFGIFSCQRSFSQFVFARLSGKLSLTATCLPQVGCVEQT